MKKLLSTIILICILTSIWAITASAITKSESLLTEKDANDNQIFNNQSNNFDYVDSASINSITPEIDIPAINTQKTIVDECIAYVGLSANEYVQVYKDSADISCEFTFYNYVAYDYVIVSYATTRNIILEDYTDDIIYHNPSKKTSVMSIDFSATPIIDINLDAHSIDFEKIIIDYEVYLNGEVVQSDSETMYVLPTASGTYVSSLGSIYAYSYYIQNLLDSELITAAQHKKAYKKMTEAREIPNSDKMTEAELNAYRQSILNKSYEMKYYDASTNTIKLASNSIWYQEKRNSSVIGLEQKEVDSVTTANIFAENEKSTSSGTNIISSFVDPVVAVDYNISVSSSGSRISLVGKMEWRDVHGSFHPARHIQIQVMDENVLGDTSIVTFYTGVDGTFGCSIDNNLGWLENGYDIYIRINFYNANFNINDGTSGIFTSTIFSDGYYLNTPTQSNVKTSIDPPRYEALDSTCEMQNKVAYIHQALKAGYYYYDDMETGELRTSDVVFPCDCTNKSNSHADNTRICIIEKDYFNWDRVIHEFAHQVSITMGIVDQDKNGEHGLNEDLAKTYDKETGIALAWAEGWATYFSVAAQEYYNKYVANISNIPWVADAKHNRLVNHYKNNVYVNTTVEEYDYNENLGFGEANETSVTGILLDLLWSDELGFIDQTLWNYFKSSGAQNLYSFVDYLYSSAGIFKFQNGELNLDRINGIGTILENRNLCAKPISETTVFNTDSLPEFCYEGINIEDTYSGNDNSNYIPSYNTRLIIINGNYQNLYIKEQKNSATIDYSIQISSEDEWELIYSHLSSGVFYWGILTYGDNSPHTGAYLSHLERGVVQ